ncbi:MAG: hypothetical protein ACT4PZ_17110 [Panacagrimonas sp.]
MIRLAIQAGAVTLALSFSACSASPPATSAKSSGGNSKVAAATRTAQAGAHCKALGDFYWEIGDGRGPIASGSIGGEYSANQSIGVASASKWVWGAYLLEKIGKDKELTEKQVAQLEMRSGFTRFNPIACLLTRTVEACYTSRSNAEVESSSVGRFSYGGGHSQRMAVDLGLGRMNAAELTQEVKHFIGTDLDLAYGRAAPAGGLEATPAGYGKFLRKIVNGELRMKNFLGFKPVCTLPRVCKGSLSSPAKEAWHYSLNHWVEDDPETGDGAFSSPGLEGFYPWISADKTTYGVLARKKLRLTSYWDSVLCGRDMRRAYFSGTAVQ